MLMLGCVACSCWGVLHAHVGVLLAHVGVLLMLVCCMLMLVCCMLMLGCWCVACSRSGVLLMLLMLGCCMLMLGCWGVACSCWGVGVLHAHVGVCCMLMLGCCMLMLGIIEKYVRGLLALVPKNLWSLLQIAWRCEEDIQERYKAWWRFQGEKSGMGTCFGV